MNLRPPLRRRLARRTSLLSTFALAAALLVNWSVPSAQAATSTSITVDGSGTGRTFDGVGAISGGGGNTRLLVDYPEPQRSQILDYLFKPGYGASLQTLKIEIGGDTNTTDGAEASHEHTKGVVDCNQGYEWWLAQQAKARNPDIKIYGLAWGAPGWVGSGTFFTADAVTYLMDWMGCAAQHNLNVDYLGGWNERSFDASWYESLKSALTSHGYTTKVVAADDNWSVADAMTTDSAFKNAVDVVGVHYPCGYNNGGAIGNNADFTTCSSTSNAQNLGKPLWASENGSQDAEAGATQVAKAVNRDYIDGRMTAYYNWPIVAGLYPNTYFAFNGLAVANEPWSGHYSIAKTAWVLAHTTQFAQIGWQYLDSAGGYLGGNQSNGSYVTLKSPNGSDYSTVIETVDATGTQTLNVHVAGGLSTGQVHVWATNLRSPYDSDHFVHTTDVTPSGGTYTLTLQPGYVYTVTTTTGQGKGTAASPSAAPLSLPYSDTFDSAAATTSPKYFTDMNGAFQTVACGGGRAGTCLRQMAATAPVRWTAENYYAPYTVMGDDSWGNYTVTADAMLEQSGAVELLGRIGMQGRNDQGLQAYHLRVGSTGAWSILRSDVNSNSTWAFTTLATGTTTALGTNQWHTVALTMQGSTINATLDGTPLGSATDSTYTHGRAGLGTVDTASAVNGGGYQTQQFDNFSVTPGSNPVPTRSGPVPSGIAGKCLDLNAGNTDNGTAVVQLYDCNQWPPSQTWTYNTDGTVTIGGKCLDVIEQGVTNGSRVSIWTCNGGDNQKWTQQTDGSLRGTQSGRCLDDPGFSTANLTPLDIWTCDGGANQRWALP